MKNKKKNLLQNELRDAQFCQTKYAFKRKSNESMQIQAELWLFHFQQCAQLLWAVSIHNQIEYSINPLPYCVIVDDWAILKIKFQIDD